MPATIRRGGALSVTQRLLVDRTQCDGYGMCAELLPELIGLDDWGYPILPEGAVPERLGDLARRAVDACPVLALRLVSASSSRSEARAGRVSLQARTLSPHTGAGSQGGG
jgi:ferredoxin